MNTGERVPVGMKIGYGFGDLGANFIFQNVSIFLLIYLTDVVGIEAAIAGCIILVAKIWDAFFDPFVGCFCDCSTIVDSFCTVVFWPGFKRVDASLVLRDYVYPGMFFLRAGQHSLRGAHCFNVQRHA